MLSLKKKLVSLKNLLLLLLLFLLLLIILFYFSNKKIPIMHSENFAHIAKFPLCEIFATIAKIRYRSENFSYAPLFCLQILFHS